MEEDNLYPLHRCVFENNVRKLSALLRVSDVTGRDKHGNTALHLAVMLGRKDCVHLLLAHGAPVKQKNIAGWSPLAEAVAYGNRQTTLLLVKKLKQQIRETMEERRPNLIHALDKIQDFYMELKWDFHSWLPLVSRLLPSDLCIIRKRGTCIRFDSTLVDFNNMKWEHGDITFLFNGTHAPGESLTLLDNAHKVYQRVKHQETEIEIEDEVDALMSNDLLSAQMSTKLITFTKAQSGWIFKEYRKPEKVGPFTCEYYDVNGMILKSRKRREHLSEEDLQKNRILMEAFTKGNNQFDGSNSNLLAAVRRPSLPPPPERKVTWDEYINADVGKHPVLNRDIVCKKTAKNYKATVAMSSDFPLSIDMLLNVLEALAPFKHFTKLRKFIQIKFPAGFPVKLDIPILPTISAEVTFQEFKFVSDLPENLFQIPSDYTEDPNRYIIMSVID